MSSRLPAALLAVALAASALQAQADSGLDGVERQLDSHRYGEAREGIARWWRDAGDQARGDQRARALYLRAVLASDLEAAERDLLRVSVEHPQSPHADRALWRLAQSRAIQGDSAAAATYLDRLLRDHPQSAHRAGAARLLGRNAAPARGAAGAAAASTRETAPRREPAASAPPRGRSATYTVQVGSFASVAEAEARRDALRIAGFRPVLARVGGSRNTVVRIGSFPERAAGEAVLRRVRAAGHSAELIALEGG